MMKLRTILYIGAFATLMACTEKHTSQINDGSAKMDKETYISTYGENDEASPGWDAIDAQLATIYGEKKPDAHVAATPHFAAGGEDPLDGVSIYIVQGPAEPHLHYVSYGMSELYYNEDAVGGESSKWGFEFTFRLKLDPDNMPTTPEDFPGWPVNLMQNLARYVFSSGKWFEPSQFVKTKGPIAAKTETEMKGLFFVLDPQLKKISTPHGEVEFVQMVGTTEDEVLGLYEAAYTSDTLFEKLEKTNALFITDMERTKSVIKP